MAAADLGVVVKIIVAIVVFPCTHDKLGWRNFEEFL
jgi:hypothetical protein